MQRRRGQRSRGCAYPTAAEVTVAGSDGSARRVRFAAHEQNESEPTAQLTTVCPPKWISESAKTVAEKRAYERGKAEAWYEGRGGEGMTGATYLAAMLGSSLLARLTEVGLVSEEPSALELLDEQVSIEDIAAYIGPDTGMYRGLHQWARDRRVLMRLGVPQESEM